jgi:hypothetical protein
MANEDNDPTKFTWENEQGTLVFEFTITPGNPPTQMSISLYSPVDPKTIIILNSDENGSIAFDNVMVENIPLNGKVCLNNSNDDHGFVEADLTYGSATAPDQQKLEGAMIEYPYTPDLNVTK